MSKVVGLHDCPSGDQLRDFSVGALSPQQVEQIALHLARSPHCTCHGTLDSLEAERDRLLDSLQRPGPPQLYEREAGCCAAIAKAESVSGRNRFAATADFGAAVGSRRAPKSLGTYRNLEPLGHGGMGDVFRAFDERLGREVALKIIRHDRFVDESSVTRFRAEATTAARLDHPNIVPIYEVNQLDERHFIVMKLIDGHPLSERAED